MRTIDLRSDTVTLPTPEMRAAMYEAEVGDDGMGEDPTTRRLEAVAAQRLGKEAAMFVTSGTMGNLVCTLTHCQRGDETIVGRNAHIVLNEGGGSSALGSVHVRTVPDDRGIPDPQDVEAVIRGANVQWPRSALVCLENTHNVAGGAVSTPEQIAPVSQIAREHGLAVHMDGARIFNAAVYLGIPVSELVKDVDSVTFCLSKGLGCPIGSVVCGSQEFIQRARRYKKMLGGVMRQVGVIAAAGIVALETMVDRLAEDHDTARRLALGLAQIPGINIDPGRVRTNIVALAVEGRTAHEFIEAVAQRGVLCNSYPDGRIRMVTHDGIGPGDIDVALEQIEGAMKAQSPVA